MLYRQHYQEVGRGWRGDFFVLFSLYVDRALGGMSSVYDCKTTQSKIGYPSREPSAAMTNLLEWEQAGKQKMTKK